MTSKDKYQAFVNGLNHMSRKRLDPVSDYDEIMMHISFDAHALSPSDTKETINSLISEGILKKKGKLVDMSALWDGQQFIMTGKSGKKLKSKPGVTGARTVRYVGPGHTQVNYATRILDIRFKESKEEFDRKAKLRRKRAAKKAAKARGIDKLYLDVDANGNAIMVNKAGKVMDLKAKSRTDKAKKNIVKARLKRDEYTIEDMRALLRDDHWEEVCGHKRWNYDRATTVREFNKYLKHRARA